jgi:hypothetical protein
MRTKEVLHARSGSQYSAFEEIATGASLEIAKRVL